MPAPDLSRSEPDQFLDGDMTPADLIELLEALNFRRAPWQREHPSRLVSIDREVRDYLVRDDGSDGELGHGPKS
jgi:hypothetical protein